MGKMTSWEGFTDRLRRQRKGLPTQTAGYLTVAADRIESLEAKLAASEWERERLLKIATDAVSLMPPPLARKP